VSPAAGRDPTRAALDHLLAQATVTQDLIRKQLGALTISAGVVDRLNTQIAEIGTSFTEPLRKLGEQFGQQWRAAMPENWRDLPRDGFFQVTDLAEKGEIAMVWVPRTEIVIELLEAKSHAEREQVLVSHRSDVLDDVIAMIEEASVCAVPAQSEAREQAREAVEAARAGLDRAAQTLFAAALGHVLEGALGFVRPGAAYKAFKGKDLNEALIVELRLVCLQLATVNALINTVDGPVGFNRHGTQHGAPEHLSEPAMLGAALLVAGWLRELSWIAEHHPEAVTGDEP
jgi:hypothetical protein